MSKTGIKGLDAIYVLNYEPLKERRDLLEKLFKKQKVNAEIVIHPKNQKSTKKELASYAFKDKKEVEKRIKYTGVKNVIELKPAEIEIYFDHINIYKKIIKNNEIAMVFEDDVIPDDDFVRKSEAILRSLEKEEWDICHICYMAGEKLPKRKKPQAERIPSRNSRTGAGYIINPKGAKKLLSIDPYVLAFDWEIRYRQVVLEMDVFWSNPHLVYQGSKYGGFYSSAIEERAKSPLARAMVWLESKRFNKNPFYDLLIAIKDFVYYRL